jgi:4-diphosphocytidyl-2-C-methyl-D-erythritol kinase
MTATVRVTAPAKINLHLQVLGQRSDGFHELAMVMQSIDLADQLDCSNSADGLIHLSCDQPGLSCGSDNLVMRAAELLRQRSGFNELGAHLHLRKRIPIGAGLAGGSSDGAAALLALNTLWGLGHSQDHLCAMAAELGSDMPFCLAGGIQLCFGRGECLESVPEEAEFLGVVLVKNPSVSVSTPWAYGECRRLKGEHYFIDEQAFAHQRQHLRAAPWLHPVRAAEPPPLRNDLQDVVAPQTASVQTALRLLQDLPGQLRTAMSGSGPSCFALFPNRLDADQALNAARDSFAKAGLDSWSCSFVAHGAKLMP